LIEYSEKFKKGKWYRFHLDEKWNSYFPNDLNFPGNYIIFFPDGNTYIGESKKILKRLKEHISMARYSNTWKTRWGYYTNLIFVIRKEKIIYERKMIECRFINKLKPTLNKAVGTWGKYGS